MAVLALSAPPLFAGTMVDTHPWFATHALVGTCNCLRVPGEPLREGDSVGVFDVGKAFARVRIASMSDGDSAKQIFDARGFRGVYPDKDLWKRIGCYWCLRAEGATPFAHLDLPESDNGDGVPLALRDLPASAVPIGGDSEALHKDEVDRLVRKAASSAPRSFLGGRTLEAGRRYRAPGGEEVLEIFLGIPAYPARGGGAPIDSIQICHLFMSREQVLASEVFSRTSGAEEHVDLEPPQLDETNWFETGVKTLGFLSLDRGKTWYWIHVDVGFEGIGWDISRLGKGMPPAWGFYLYTQH